MTSPVDSLLDIAGDIVHWGDMIMDRHTPAEVAAIVTGVHNNRDPLNTNTVSDESRDRRAIDFMGMAISSSRDEHHGERVWVSREMIALCRSAASSLPEVKFDLDDLPWDVATAVFEEPIVTLPDLGMNISVPMVAVQWRPTLANVGDESVEGAVHCVWWGMTDLGIIPIMGTLWRVGTGPMEEGDTEMAGEVHRTIYTLWSMLRDKIALTDRGRAPKASARRWERRTGRPPEDIVTVILRRPDTSARSEATGQTIDWTHQWVVGGHWRNQWYPSLNAHKPKWIAPYVKGPDDKPLVVKEHVNLFVR